MQYDTLVTQLHAIAAQRDHPHALVRGHLRDEGVHLYIRLGLRFCGRRVYRALVLADVEVDPALRRQGFFRLLLRRLEAEAPRLELEAVVAENVINPHLLPFLLRQGYRPVHHTHDTLYKETPQ